MLTERFTRLRKNELLKIFDKEVIKEIWRNIVRNQLRSLDLKDLYDHYDFNYNIEERVETIQNEILNGTYKISQPLIYRVEKKFGICRHLVIPQPTDALVLQVLIENVADKILENQPSENAFYSRAKHDMAFPHSVEEYGMTWRQQWRKLQKKIYHFHQEKELIAVTDISNYYDSIDMKELRKVFTSYSKIKEVLIDILFEIIEEISWRPDYLPYSGKGLPTTNIEGIRLLAHSFLFEIDEVIKQQTKDNFARWMDDIVIGINTKKEAVETISSVSDMLKSRGLALNVSKTNIYSAKEGFYHFQIKANRYIDRVEKTKKTDPNYKKICSKLHKSFKSHFKNKSAKYWEKVAKRYITAYGKLQSKSLLSILPRIYVEYPGLRVHLLIYLSKFGYTQKTCQVVIKILEKIDIFDDLSLYQICFLVTEWDIPINKKTDIFLAKFDEMITMLWFRGDYRSGFYCVLWFKAKYSHPEALLNFILKYQNLWEKDSFLRRQVTSTLSRLLITNSKAVEELLYGQISSGILNTVILANQLFRFSKIKKLDFSLNVYLFPKNIQKPYPIGKFLVLCSVLNSEDIRTDKLVRSKVKQHIKDPYYLKWLDSQYNIS